MYKVWSYSPSDKMSDLICDNYPMILVLNRFDIAMGFKDGSIGEVCEASGVDVDTFLAIVNLLIAADSHSVEIDPTRISLEAVVSYLARSHKYFSEYKFQDIRAKLEAAICSENAFSQAILSYFDEYVSEVERHMNYEDEVVFSSVERLLSGHTEGLFNIDLFSDHHECMDSKLVELKNIIIKYYPAQTTNELSGVLFEIFAAEDDLESHTLIEDHILIPVIRELMNR